MQFLLKAYDGEGMLEKRMAVRPRHLLDSDGKMKGSALILDFPDRSGLDKYLSEEPYVQEHVWEKIEIERINVVIPK